MVSMIGVLVGAALLFATLNVPVENRSLFGLMLGLTALFIPISSPNVTSTINDVALPEIRSTALAIQYFVESSGAALAPLMTGMIADAFRQANHPRPRESAILMICISTWILCGIIYFFTTYHISKDIESLRDEMSARAKTKV